ncbi:unnamed protein product [Callosobruchus maculatus]|uniref:Uncharacterized protein n=1 Tax=Callosobruchus maculatus TaxID=64391 RepID=A0A653CBN0_CALMS|nr:unnamed protein product [Callosobruchus maculatus]
MNTMPFFKRNGCNKFFMISEDMVVNMCFPFKCRIAIDTRILILFRCKTTPRFRMFR